MPNYYHNKMTGELISYDPETGKVCEFEQVQLYEVEIANKEARVRAKLTEIVDKKFRGGGRA